MLWELLNIYENMCTLSVLDLQLPLQLVLITTNVVSPNHDQACDKVCQWLVADRWFSPSTPVSSTNKTDRLYSKNIVESGDKHHNPNPMVGRNIKNALHRCWFYVNKFIVICYFGFCNEVIKEKSHILHIAMNFPFKQSFGY
jgi:hypothetical protein